MIQVPRGLGRVPPDPKNTEELRKHLRLSAEDAARRHADLAERVPGDKFDRLTFASAGDGAEVKIPNTLGFRPTHYAIGRKKGRYTVWDQRESFADDAFIYLVTDAPKGTIFTVRFYD